MLDFTVLAVESSCDETAVAVVRNGRQILSNVIATQIELHRRFGGVFPEMASRQHVLAITNVYDQAIVEAGLSWDEIDGVAATYGPGLAGSLLVGLNFAKGLALAHGKPFLGVNHLEGHIYSNWLTDGKREVPEPEFPALILIVSGGHTELFLMQGHGEYELLGQTLDDAAGEAFDKVARLLNLPYPGGPHLQKAAETGNPKAVAFPRSFPNDFDFSFSGIKTSVLREVEKIQQRGEELPVADLAASFQQAVVDTLVTRVAQAAEMFNVKQVLIAGGVAANKPLREAMYAKIMGEMGIPMYSPPIILCTDNAAAIGGAAYWRFVKGEESAWGLEIMPNLKLFG